MIKSDKEEQSRDAYRMGFADAQNGVSCAEGKMRYSRKHEQEAYILGYYKGQQKQKAFTGGEDD